jgi:hypothetical protein
MGLPGTSEIISTSQKKCPYAYPYSKPYNTQDSIPISSRQSQQRSPGTSKKNKSTDHGKHTEDKPDNRRRTTPWPELFKKIGGNQGPYDEAYNLGAHVLYQIGTV